jgi:DNA invertase Pin-like site-specific DNA recombinase
MAYQLIEKVASGQRKELEHLRSGLNRLLDDITKQSPVV